MHRRYEPGASACRRSAVIEPTGNLAAGDGWTRHHLGAFRRAGAVFVDVTRSVPAYPWAGPYRLRVTPRCRPSTRDRRAPATTSTGTTATTRRPPQWVSSAPSRRLSRCAKIIRSNRATYRDPTGLDHT